MTTYDDELSRYYKILGIEPGASPAEAKQAYRDLVKVWHPDRFSHDPKLQQKAQEKLKEINIAYEKLSDWTAQTGTYTRPRPEKSEQEADNSKDYQSSKTERAYGFKKEQERDNSQGYQSSENKETHGFKREPKGRPKRSGMFIRYIIVLFCFAVYSYYFSEPSKTTAPTMSTPPRSNADANYTRGFDYFDKNQYDEAIEEFNKAIALEPNRANAYYIRGTAYFNKNQYDKAIEDSSNAVALKPDYADAYLLRGISYLRKSLGNLALSDLQHACSLGSSLGCNEYKNAIKKREEPESTITYEVDTDQGTFQVDLDREPKSQEELHRVIKRHLASIDLSKIPDNKSSPLTSPVEYWFRQGDRYLVDGNYDLAIDAFSKFIATNNNHAYAYFGRGTAYYYKKQYDRAIEDYNKAVSIYPNDVDARLYFYRGFAYLYKKQYDRAIEDYNKAVTIDASDADAYYGRGVAYLRKGLQKLALSDLQHACNLGSASGCKEYNDAVIIRNAQ